MQNAEKIGTGFKKFQSEHRTILVRYDFKTQEKANNIVSISSLKLFNGNTTTPQITEQITIHKTRICVLNINMDALSITSISTSNSSTSTSSNSASTSKISGLVRLEDLGGELDLATWKTGNVTRYVLPNLIKSVDRSDKKKDDDSKMLSDAVVWSLYYLTENSRLPTQEPTLTQRNQACAYLMKLKAALNGIFLEETQKMYWFNSNDEQWDKLRGKGEKFKSFKDLVTRTSDCTSELVSM